MQEQSTTVPMETPQSMLEDPSSGSNTTQYLHHQNKLVAEILHEENENRLPIRSFKCKTSIVEN